jgi:hypothetical protein
MILTSAIRARSREEKADLIGCSLEEIDELLAMPIGRASGQKVGRRTAGKVRTRGRITQAYVARVIRAAQQTGAGGVELKPDGSISISLSIATEAKPVGPRTKVVL